VTSAAAPAARPSGRRELWLRVASGLVLGAGVLAALVYGGWPFAGIWLAAGIVAIGAVGLLNLPYVALLATIFLIGCCTTGSMTVINGMTAALYPARVRNTGMGWALGIGRLGGIGGPWLGGLLLGLGWPPRQIFLFACVTALVAAIGSPPATAPARCE